MKILIGQGNPGPKYAGNRHNIGFMAVEHIAEKYEFGPWRSKFQSEISEGRIKDEKALLIKPQTFYNETGRAAHEAVRFYKADSNAITVFHDEIDLAPGRMKVKTGGGHSGNNGIRSLLAHLSGEFCRIRLGIGHPGDKALVTPYVLSDFAKSETEWRDALLGACASVLPLLFAYGPERFQTEVMRLAPAPKADPKRA